MRDIIVKESQGVYTAFIREGNGDLLEAEIPEPPSSESAWLMWARELSELDLEIAMRVAYDRWAWETGSKKDKKLWTLLEAEKDIRYDLGYFTDQMVRALQDNYNDHV